MKKVLLIALGTLVIIISAGIDLEIPGIPVPQTAQTLALLLVIACLPARLGVYSVALYLGLGVLGLPVFSEGGRGLAHLFGNTGGYLVGFLLAALFLEYVLNKINFKKIIYAFGASLKAHLIILFSGWGWLGTKVGFFEAYEYGVEPFLIGAVVKSIPATFALIFTAKMRSIFRRFGL